MNTSTVCSLCMENQQQSCKSGSLYSEGVMAQQRKSQDATNESNDIDPF